MTADAIQPDVRDVFRHGHQADDDPALRPKSLAEFFGQPKACGLLAMAISGARFRSETVDHILLYGPPGLGKTTLANILATEMGSGFRSVAAPSIQRAGDMASVLVSLSEGDILFIDETHRLPPQVCEMLYGAMEDFRLDLLSGAPGAMRAMSIPLPRFTLVGATTRPGQLPRPMRDRFGIDIPLLPYSDEDMVKVILRSARLLGIRINDVVAWMVAERSRSTPRIANRLLRRIRDYAVHDTSGGNDISPELSVAAFDFLQVDAMGLDRRDRFYLSCLRQRNRPVGLKTLSILLGEDEITIEDEIEPWLMLKGLIDRTPQGRVITDSGVECLA